MKDYKEIYSQPRFNAFTAMSMSQGDEDLLAIEFQVEAIVNDVFGLIHDRVRDCLQNPLLNKNIVVTTNHIKSDLIKMGVLDRINSFGYRVDVVVGSDEEAKHVDEIGEMALEDSSLYDILDDFFYSQDKYIIGWSMEDLEKNMGEDGNNNYDEEDNDNDGY